MPKKIISIDTPFKEKFRNIIDGKYESKGIKAITQAELARKTNISKTQIGQYYNGYSRPGMSQLIDLSNCFGCSIDFLVKVEVKEPKPQVQAIIDTIGFSEKTLTLIKGLNISNEDYPLITRSLEILLGHVGCKYGDVLTPLSKFLLGNTPSDLFVVREDKLDAFEELLSTSNSLEAIRHGYQELMLANFSEPQVFTEIKERDILLEIINTRLTELMHSLIPDEDNDSSDDTIDIDWPNIPKIKPKY